MKKQYTGSVIVAIILSVLILFCSSMTASSTGKGAASDNAFYYHELEKHYVEAVRSVMNEQGYFNAGVNMNHYTNVDGERTYTVKLHHSRLLTASQDKTQAILNILEEIPFEDGEVLYEII